MKHYKELHALGNKKTKKYLEENGLFKRYFKVGDFMKLDDCQVFGIITKIHLSCGKLETIDFDGISYCGELVVEDYINCFEGLTHPTDKEILEHLAKVAELKGYKKGVKVKCSNTGEVGELEGTYWMHQYGLSAKVSTNWGCHIWDKETNTWAEIIEEPKYMVRYDYPRGRKLVFKNGSYVADITDKTIANEICEYLINKK
jgi:hypothetical protein